MHPPLPLAPTEQLLAHRNWRTEWTLERTCLFWYLTFGDEPGLMALFDEVSPLLGSVACVDVVPPDWLHLTVLDVGYADEVVRSDVDHLVAAAETARELMPRRLELGPVTTMTDAVVLQVSQSEELVAVESVLAHGLRSRRPGAAWEPFVPHVSVGYLNSDARSDEVMSALEEVRSRSTWVSVPQLTLAAVTRLETHYQWQAVATLSPGTG